MAISWIKKGAESEALAKSDDAKKQAFKESMGKLWRFFLKDKEEARITFIDGDLTDNGHLSPPRFYEHTLKINGKVENFVCPQETCPEDGHKCPLCASGDRPALVSLFTIIDHRKYTNKQGVAVLWQKRLFVAKPLSMEVLTKLAIKRGGLAGTTWDVTRLGESSAAIGSMFDFVEKSPMDLLTGSFMETVEGPGGAKITRSAFTAADYDSEIIFRTPMEMLALGIGATGSNMQSGFHSPAPTQMFPGGSNLNKPSDYSKDL